MGNCGDDTETEEVTTPSVEALPDLNPWREVGWIFRDGDCVAIARHASDEPPASSLVD